MGSNGTEKIPSNNCTEGSETTIGIKIKTLDSQTYTLRVDKQMPVPTLKEQIASVTGVLSERQRLICRGKVLKDDQLLSAYHVEDGHTLHLVVRQPDLPSPGSLPNHSATDPNSSTSHGHSNQVAPGVFVETFNVPVQGDGVPPEINRIVSAVLGSIGISNFVRGSEGIYVGEHDSHGFGRTSGGISGSSHPQPAQADVRNLSDRLRNIFGSTTAVSLGSLQPPVIPDSLTTLSLYLNHIGNEFDAIVREGEDSAEAAEAHRNEEIGSISSPRSGSTPEGLSSPASLAEVLLSSRQMLIEQVCECLLQLARQLENQASVTDPFLRSSAQSRAWRTGVLFYNLGASLLELGRTTMTLRLGQTPSEAVVNGGPAVYISPSGPNHIMVQPLPFQPATSFGAVPVGVVQSSSGLGGGLGSSFLPRRIDIQIRRGTSTTTPIVNREEHVDNQSASVQRNPGENFANQATSRLPDDSSFAGEPGVQIVPIRTMVAAIPGPLGHPPSESSGNSVGLYYPVLGRFQHISSGHGNSEQGSQPSSQHPVSGLNSAQQSIPESTVHRQPMEDPARYGSLPNSNIRQAPSATRSVNINILTPGGVQHIQESERQMPNNVLQSIRSLFPGDEVHVEDFSLQGTTAGSTSEHAGTSRVAAHIPEAEPRVSDEGIILSNLLCEIMPLISQQAGSGTPVAHERENASEDEMAQDFSTQAGTSRRQSDSEPSPPNPKRQKIE